MPAPILVVELPTQDRAPTETSALIEACTAGMRGGRCELSQNGSFEAGNAVAIVSWRNGERLSVLVEVGRQRGQTAIWRTEELYFKPEDQQLERFRALGIAIAALYREAIPESSNSPAPVPNRPARSKRRSASPTERVPREAQPEPETELSGGGSAVSRADSAASSDSLSDRRAVAWVSAGPNATYDPGSSAWRYGGKLQVAAGLVRFPAFVSAFGSYARGDSAGVSLSWVGLGLGLGLRQPLPANFELRGAACGLLVNVAGQASEAGRTSRESVWVAGAGLELELGVQASNVVGVALAGDLQRYSGDVPIREHGQAIGNVSKTALGIALTLEVRLFQTATAHR